MKELKDKTWLAFDTVCVILIILLTEWGELFVQIINLFVPNASFVYLLKTSEDLALRFSDVFRG